MYLFFCVRRYGVALVCLAWLMPSALAQAPLIDPVRIMPFGDSITLSFSDKPSYRRALWFMLQDAGYYIDLVGSQTLQWEGPNPYGDFDLDHEGHGGFRTENLLSATDTWAANAQPDIVLLHAGTTDANQDRPAEETAANIAAMIDVLRGRNPQVIVLLALIIGAPDSTMAFVSGRPLNGEIEAINALIPGVAASKSTDISPVYLVDHYGNFDRNTLTWDGIHPTVEGETVIAQTWFEALAPILDGLGAGCPPQGFHSADIDRDSQIGLLELLRIIQFYNAGSFGCAVGTEDGFAPYSTDQSCCPHDSDYAPAFTRTWSVGLEELLRAIQLFNAGAYNYCPRRNTEDRFCAGPAS
jgi:lysophospholipase L1-like esterase